MKSLKESTSILITELSMIPVSPRSSKFLSSVFSSPDPDILALADLNASLSDHLTMEDFFKLLNFLLQRMHKLEGRPNGYEQLPSDPVNYLFLHLHGTLMELALRISAELDRVLKPGAAITAPENERNSEIEKIVGAIFDSEDTLALAKSHADFMKKILELNEKIYQASCIRAATNQPNSLSLLYLAFTYEPHPSLEEYRCIRSLSGDAVPQEIQNLNLSCYITANCAKTIEYLEMAIDIARKAKGSDDLNSDFLAKQVPLRLYQIYSDDPGLGYVPSQVGFTPDQVKAQKYLKLAADCGSQTARDLLDLSEVEVMLPSNQS